MDELELKSAQENLRKKGIKKAEETDKVYALLTAASKIGETPVTHEIGGFKFDTLAVIPVDVKDKYITDMIKLRDGEAIDAVGSCAELMSQICIDKELQDKDVWVEFNERSGALLSVCMHMVEELSINMEQMKTFRKK